MPAAAYTITIVPADLVGNVGSPVGILVTTLAGPKVPPPPVGQIAFASSATPGMMELQWQGGGEGWLGTMDFTDSLQTPQWLPVPPTDQWPASLTRLTVAISAPAPGRYYRVRPAF